MTNNTPSTGQPLIVLLAGRTGTREPTGAVVKLRFGDREIVRLLTAGDGYLVTNDRFVHFAVPQTEPLVELEVRWPGGLVERWSRVRTGTEILVIEGRRQPVVLQTFADAPVVP